MSQVALYTLKKEEVLVTSDYINFCGNVDRPIHVRGSDECIVDAPVEVKQVPVERYVNLQGRSEKECLVAFDPEIRKLLGINEKALKEELRQLSEEYQKSLRNISKLNTDNLKLEQENSRLCSHYKGLDNFFTFVPNMSFWQRLVFLFTGVVKG